MADLTKRNYKSKIKNNNNNNSSSSNNNNNLSDSNICEKAETEEELRKKIEIISNQLEKAKTESQRDNHDKTKLEEEFKKLNCKVVEYKVKIDDMRLKIDSTSKNNNNFDDDDSSSNDDDTSQMPVATNSLLMSCTDIRRTDDDDDDDRNGTMLPTLYDQESSGSSVFTSSGYDSVSNFDFSSINPNQDEGIQLTHHQMDNSDYCIVNNNNNNNIRPDITDEQDFENIDKIHNSYSYTDDNNNNIDDHFEYIQNNSNTFSPTSTNAPPKIATNYNPVAYQYNKVQNTTNNYPQQEYINITQPQSSMYTQQMNISPTDEDNRFDYEESPITPQHQEYQHYQRYEQNISPPSSPLKKQFHDSYPESSNYDDVISYSNDVKISSVSSNNHLKYDNTDGYIKDNMHVAGSSDDDTDYFINSRSGSIPKKRNLQRTKYSQNNNNIDIDRLQEQQEKRKSMPVDRLNSLYEKQMNQNPPRQRQAASNSIRPCNSLGSRGQFDNSASLRRDSYLAPLSGKFDIEKADALLNGRSSYSSASYYSESQKNQKTKPVYKRERSFTRYETSPRYAPHPDTIEQRYLLHRTDAYPTYDSGERNFSQTNTGLPPPPNTATSNRNRAIVGVSNSYNRSASNRSNTNQNVRPLPIQPINHQYDQMQSPLDSDASDSGIGSYFGQEITRPSTTIAYNPQGGQYLQVSAPGEPSKAEYKEIIDNLKQQVEDLTYKINSIQHTALPESPPITTQSNKPPHRTGPSVVANNPKIIYKPVNKVPSPNLSNNRNPQEKLSPRMLRPNLLHPSTKETYPSRTPIIYAKALSGTPSTYKTKQNSQLVIPVVTARNNHPNVPRTTNIPQPGMRHNGPRSKSSMQQPSNITSNNNNNNSNNTSTSSSNSGGGVHHYPTTSTIHKSAIIRPLSSQNIKKPPQIYGSRMKMPPPPM